MTSWKTFPERARNAHAQVLASLGIACSTLIANALGAGNASAARNAFYAGSSVALLIQVRGWAVHPAPARHSMSGQRCRNGQARRWGSAWHNACTSPQVVVAAPLVIWRDKVPLLFTSAPEVVEAACRTLPIVAVSQLADGVTALFSGALRGVGRQKWGALLNLTACECSLERIVYLGLHSIGEQHVLPILKSNVLLTCCADWLVGLPLSIVLGLVYEQGPVVRGCRGCTLRRSASQALNTTAGVFAHRPCGTKERMRSPLTAVRCPPCGRVLLQGFWLALAIANWLQAIIQAVVLFRLDWDVEVARAQALVNAKQVQHHEQHHHHRMSLERAFSLGAEGAAAVLAPDVPIGHSDTTLTDGTDASADFEAAINVVGSGGGGDGDREGKEGGTGPKPTWSAADI